MTAKQGGFMEDKDTPKGHRPIIYVKIIVNYVLAALLVLALIFLVPRLLGFMWPFVVGWIIALIANPLVHLLEKKVRIVRKHGSAIVIILVLAIVISLLYLLFYVLIKQGISFANNFPDMYDSAASSIQETIESWRNKYEILPLKSREFIDMIVGKGGELLNNFAGEVTSNGFTFSDAGNVVKNVAEGLLMTVITILLSYFLTAEHDNFVAVFREKMPIGIKSTYTLIKDSIISAVGGYFKAQFKIMCFVFIILAIGLLVMRIDYAILFALIIAFVDFLPVFGAGAIMWPWCIYEVITGDYVSAIVLFILYLVCQAVRQFLQPKMVADSIGLSPLSTLFFMFVGYRLGGVLGMIIGIPIGMILVSFNKAGLFDNLIRGAKIMIQDLNKWRKF